eukprot:14180751-Alexandrium_andersonii.AAC.1
MPLVQDVDLEGALLEHAHRQHLVAHHEGLVLLKPLAADQDQESVAVVVPSGTRSNTTVPNYVSPPSPPKNNKQTSRRPLAQLQDPT